MDSLTPPATPSQRLLDAELQPQYARYTPSEKSENVMVPEDKGSWVPYPLRPWFWIPFFVLLVLLAIGLEIALHFSNKNNGWTANGDAGDDVSLWHYVYLVGLWAWTDIEIKKMQQLHCMDTRSSQQTLSRCSHDADGASDVVFSTTGRSTAHRQKYLVADAGWCSFIRLAFLTAAGFASSSSLYDLPDPPFISGPYTVASFELPGGIETNGTVLFVNTTALKSNPGCQAADVTMTSLANDSWNNSISVQGCSLSWVVNDTAEVVFGVNATNCSTDTPQFSPVVFWFFSYSPSAQASATICFPTFELFDVEINYDLAAQNVTQVTELGPFTSSSNFSSASGNITGSPLNGRAYNGIEFNLTNPDQFVLARQAAIQLQMSAAVLQKAEESSAGLQGSFTSNSFVPYSSEIYTTYLTLLAQTVYFLPSNELNTIQVKTIIERLFLSDVAVHLLAVAMIIVAFFGTIAQLFHRYDRRQLRLRHQPGTIASAVSIGGQTGMGALLAGRQDQKDIDEVLSNRKFRIDPRTMKIIMEGEEGYEFASSPKDRRKSVFAALQNLK
ncbi:hypothetical protein F5050DRAFT_1560083 [Lentinula boryana]|uniref:Transmembrane protein n=1 Tax=Lentinula boryana TaxID=40481 RepID=A0ABQ8QTF4_9AGAR|nr:hypothetical protein F5050DRAFT_1560083 [Lentinula boryana]